MTFDARWRTLRERCDSLDPDAVLVTPGDERVFAVDRTDETAILVTFRDDGERTLRRDQFEVLADRVAEDPLSLDELPPGVGPYVSVLSLAPGFAVEAGALEATDGTAAESEDGATSPFRRSRWDVRRPPEEVHDDALLVADWLERHDATELGRLSSEDAVDLYVLLSDLQWGADDLRRGVGDELLDSLGPDGRLHGQYGSVTRTGRERRQLKDEDEILNRLDEEGVPHEWVLGVDEEKLDVVVATTNVDERDVYDVHDQYYVQKTSVESGAKRSRLQGLKDRLDDLGDEDADELRDEIETLEARIDDLLAAG
ncbi:hypothetical protein [Halosimplex salinum]|uniref:hypothetical protein n=1 Tax=Halosimplex salinum TaxID=1710538 RepID=UPI000F46DFD6|nr:hypothetical protein [Halosimplex salinum]